MEPNKHFQFCPKCGQPRRGHLGAGPFRCEACGFVYYFNPAIAAAAFVLASDDRILFIRRAKEPAKGKLAIPGGFVDAGETAEDALRREVREEVNLEPSSIKYLCSFPNHYSYHGVTYHVLDFFFVVRTNSTEQATAMEDVESLGWMYPAEIDTDEIAFPSIRHALQVYCLKH